MPVDEGFRGQSDNNSNGPRLNLPVPDPSLLTTQQLREAVSNLKELVFARLDAMDAATDLRLDAFNRLPAETATRVDNLREVQEEKFRGIAQQFNERDVRTGQASSAADDALKAALQAAKELVGAQGEASAAAAVKSETSFALALDTPLLTIDGWKTMGTVETGDTIFAEDGSPTRVISTSGIFRDSPCYLLRFTDGSVLVATADHRWHVYDVRAWHGGWGVWKTLTTQEIIDSGWHRLRNGGNGYRYRIRTDAVLQTPEAQLPIDPYIFGYWLGDGSSTSPTLTVGDEDKDHLVGAIAEAGYRISNERRNTSPWGTASALHFTSDAPRGSSVPAHLKSLGVFATGLKHIPDIYLTASPAQRRDVLAGLLDSDGTISRATWRVTFNSTLEPLASGVRQLARSLGQRAVIHKYGDNYHVTWTPTEAPFRLARKNALFRVATSRQREWASITDIAPVPTVPTRCLTVEHPSHVFLAGHGFTATCNTKQIDQIGTIIQTLEKALDARITELKERIDRGEGSMSGASSQRTERRSNTGVLTAAASVGLSLVFLIISIVSLIAQRR